MKVVDDLVKHAGPLLQDAYAFSQIAGKLMVMADEPGPPATYYIADPDPGSSTPTGKRDPAPEAYTQVAGIGLDQAAGFPLAGSSYGIFLGPAQSAVALAIGASANGSPIMSGNPTIVCGPGQLPLAGVGTSTATGMPVLDGYPEGVQMAMPTSHSPTGKHTVYTAAGAGMQPEQGLAWDTGFADELKPYYDCVGVQYPALLFPMAPGIEEGTTDLIKKIAGKKGGFALVGYSEGSILTSHVWRDEILNPNGQLHDRLGDIFAYIAYGHPLRCPGIARGNARMDKDVPMPLDGYVTGGIAGPDDLTPWQTPPWLLDYANDGDMYAACPVGADPWSNEAPPGKAETSIYNIVMLKFAGQSTIIPEIGHLLLEPIPTMVAIIEGLINTIGFFGAAQGPHVCYADDGSKDDAIAYLRERGSARPA
jgi:hypothetical protein